MFCSNCGESIKDNSNFCSSCGFDMKNHESNISSETQDDRKDHQRADSPLADEATITQILSQYKNQDVFVFPNIPLKKIEAIEKYYKVPENEKVLGVVDSTVFGSCKYGIAFTISGIYWKSSVSENPEVNYLSWIELIPYKNYMKGFTTVKLSKKISIDISGAKISGKNFIKMIRELIQSYISTHSIDETEFSPVPKEDLAIEWYHTGWVWGWVFLFWPVAVYGFWMRGGESRGWVAASIGFLFLAVIFGDSSEKTATSLSEKHAITTCHDAWEQEVFGTNHIYYSPVKYKGRWAINTGENKFRSVVEFTSRGVIKRFACDVFLEKGEVMYRVTNRGG